MRCKDAEQVDRQVVIAMFLLLAIIILGWLPFLSVLDESEKRSEGIARTMTYRHILRYHQEKPK